MAECRGKSPNRSDPGLKELVMQATQALARLDAGRLEELALSCQALNRNLANGLVPASSEDRTDLLRQAAEAVEEMAAFAGVLGATRTNLLVMRRLKNLRSGHQEYGEA